MIRNKSKPVTKERQDVLTTLAIAALLHETDEAVRQTAKRLIDKAPGSICKSVLRPLSESHQALQVVIEEIIYPTQEKYIGTVNRDNYEYDIVVKWRGDLEYMPDDIVSLTAGVFVQRGIVTGRIYMNIRHALYRDGFRTSKDLNEFSKFSMTQHNQAA